VDLSTPCTSEGYTAAFYCIEKVEALAVLKGAGVDLAKACSPTGHTVAFFATQGGHAATTEWLSAQGVDVSISLAS
jgi:hypothetical protein